MTGRVPTTIRRFARDRSGVAAVELALLAPLLCTVLAATINFGYAFNIKLQVVNGTTAGALYAFSNAQTLTPGTFTTFVDGVKSSVVGAARLSPDPVVTVLVNNAADSSTLAQFYCVGGSPATYASTGSSSASCGGNVSSGRFVTITTKATTPSWFLMPGLFDRTFFTPDTTVVRIQ